MNCANCGAPMIYHRARATFECQYCLGVYIPEADDQGLRMIDEQARHICPLCDQPLVWADLDGFPAEICPQCRGVLMLQSLFGKAVRVLRARARTPAVEPGLLDRSGLERRVRCPGCCQEMDNHIYAGPGNIVIDTCLNCGLIWLDYRELRQVLDTPGRDRGA
ncbi:MAG: zf-TFIIB domain-containing protein [Anaerolineales bacterium]|jgi:Zn-finger nucleic acid-binding protein